MIALALLFAGHAQAASLDLLEVGGPWGTPGATNSTAVWWNPAGLAVGEGTRFTIEVAPTVASIGMEREDEYNGGEQDYSYVGVSPFLGVASDFGVKNFGAGLAIFAPQARGATEVQEGGPGRTHLRGANILTLNVMASASYNIAKKVSLGAGVGYTFGNYTARLDNELTTILGDQIAELMGGSATDYYDDSYIERSEYLVDVNMKGLQAHGVVFNAGIVVTPIDILRISASYNHGWVAKHQGSVTMDFSCPPDEDALGRLGAELRGICNADMVGRANVDYPYPGRLNFGVTVLPTRNVRVEAMGGLVFWKPFQNFNIRLSEIESLNTSIDEETAELLAMNRDFARDHRMGWWTGVDGKFAVGPAVLGARVLWDASVVEDSAMSPNNFDTNQLYLGAMAGANIGKNWTLTASFTEVIAIKRTVTENGFAVTVDPANRNPDRYFWPQMNGTYKGNIHRFGIQLRGRFGSDGSSLE